MSSANITATDEQESQEIAVPWLPDIHDSAMDFAFEELDRTKLEHSCHDAAEFSFSTHVTARNGFDPDSGALP